VAKILKSQRVHVTVVDKSKDVCERLAKRLDVDVVRGDATDPLTLEEARIEEAKVFLALTGDDSVNTISSLMARRYGVEKIIARIEDLNYANVCRANNIEVVSFAESASLVLEALIYHNRLVELTSLIEEEGLDIEYVDYRKGSGLPRFKRNEAYPIMVVRGSEVLLPSPELSLEDGDKVFVIRRRRKLFHVPEL